MNSLSTFDRLMKDKRFKASFDKQYKELLKQEELLKLENMGVNKN